MSQKCFLTFIHKLGCLEPAPQLIHDRVDTSAGLALRVLDFDYPCRDCGFELEA